MTESETRKKKRRKQALAVLAEQQETDESQNVAEVTEVLEELEKQGKRVDIQVCPKCKSPRIRRARTSEGDIASHMGFLPPKFQCEECGWQERLVLKATNKPLTVREIELILEANECKDDETK